MVSTAWSRLVCGGPASHSQDSTAQSDPGPLERILPSPMKRSTRLPQTHSKRKARHLIAHLKLFAALHLRPVVDPAAVKGKGRSRFLKPVQKTRPYSGESPHCSYVVHVCKVQRRQQMAEESAAHAELAGERMAAQRMTARHSSDAKSAGYPSRRKL